MNSNCIDIKVCMDRFFEIVLKHGHQVFVSNSRYADNNNYLTTEFDRPSKYLFGANVARKFMCDTKTQIWDTLLLLGEDSNPLAVNDEFISLKRQHTMNANSICVFPNFDRLMNEMYAKEDGKISSLFHECDDELFLTLARSWIAYMVNIDYLGDKQTILDSSIVENINACSRLNWFFKETELMNIFSPRKFYMLLQMVNAGIVNKSAIDEYLNRLDDDELNARFEACAKKFIEQGVGEADLHLAIDDYVDRFEQEIVLPTGMFNSKRDVKILCQYDGHKETANRLECEIFSLKDSYYSRIIDNRLSTMMCNTVVVTWTYELDKLVKEHMKSAMNAADNFTTLHFTNDIHKWVENDIGYYGTLDFERSYTNELNRYETTIHTRNIKSHASFMYFNTTGNHGTLYNFDRRMIDEKYDRSLTKEFNAFLNSYKNEDTGHLCFALFIPIMWHAIGKSREDLNIFLPKMQ